MSSPPRPSLLSWGRGLSSQSGPDPSGGLGWCLQGQRVCPMMGDTPQRSSYPEDWTVERRLPSGKGDPRPRGQLHPCLGGRRLDSKNFSQNRFCDVLWCRSSSTPRRRFSVFSQYWVFSAVQQRFVEQNHVTQVRWRRSPTSPSLLPTWKSGYFYGLYLRTLALVFMRQSTAAFGRNSLRFLRECGPES